MLDFLKDNYKLIIICVLIIINLVFSIVKKVKTCDNVWTYIMSIIPDLINQVEAPGNGSTKLTAVISVLSTLLADHFDMSEDKIASYVIKAQAYIEKVLSTPQKKGITCNENKTEN